MQLQINFAKKKKKKNAMCFRDKNDGEVYTIQLTL